MKCVNCDNKKNLKRELKAIKFEESGLDYITLVNVPTYHCDKCGEDYQEIPKPKQLMSLIAKSLAFKKEQLTAQEFVFLRKFLGYSRTQLSSLLRYSYEHLNRVEKGGGVQAHLDRAIRILAIGELKCSPYDLLDEASLMEFKRLCFNPTAQGWEKDAA